MITRTSAGKLFYKAGAAEVKDLPLSDEGIVSRGILIIGYCLRVIKLTFRALALRQSDDEGLTLETSALYSLRWPIYIFNLVDITKLHRKISRNATYSDSNHPALSMFLL